MAEQREGKKLKGVLKSLFANVDRGENPVERARTIEPGEQAAETVPEGEPQPFAPQLYTITGSLLKLWEYWSEGRGLPPRVSLTGELSRREGAEDAWLGKLEQEWARVALKMELNAKRQLLAVEKARNEAFAKAARETDEAQRKAIDRGQDPKGIRFEPEEIHMDAQYQVFISRDRLVAWLMIIPPFGDGALRMDAVGRALQEQQVTSGLDTARMMNLAEEKPYFRLIPIAVGTPAVEGTNGKVVERFSRKQEFAVSIDEEGVADYRSCNFVRQIYKDDVICEIIPPVEGTAGLSVDGKVLQPKAVRPARVPRGRNTKLSDDGLQLLSTMNGHLEFKEESFHVRPVMEIPGDVDYTTGNIHFVGDVHVKGDVRENFSVIATGSVTIDGLVEAATVEADGDLVITKGVVGDNRALLKCGGTVRAKYLESCVIYARKCIYSDCIMNSQVFCDGSIDVTSGRGCVVGGALVAATNIRAKMIGAESGRRTELTMGTLPATQMELSDLQNEMEANHDEDDELERQLSYLEARQGMQGSDPRIAKARMRRSVLAMKRQQITHRIEQLEEQEVDLSQCRLECDLVYPVTTLTVNGAIWTAKSNIVRCRVAYNEKERCLIEVP